MKIDTIKAEIYTLIKERFIVVEKNEFIEELLDISDKSLYNKVILRIKRQKIDVNRWKSIVLVEIDYEDSQGLKSELKKVISWIAEIRGTLCGSENTDLYLFLVINGDVSVEECLRIESTEQFCRKYVLLPEEEPIEFVNRTFLQRISEVSDSLNPEDPIEKAFAETEKEFGWITDDIKDKWKAAFENLSGNELADELLKGDNVI